MLMVLLISTPTFGQTTISRMKVQSDGKILVIKEFGGLISEAEDGFSVGMVLPPSSRASEYKKLDIQPGDIIRMVNGRKIGSIDELEEFYGDLEFGQEIQLGIIRGKEMMIRKFPKADPEKLPRQMHAVTVTDETNNGFTILRDLGMILSVNDNLVQISQIIKESDDLTTGYRPQMGDFIKSIQGSPVNSFEDVAAVYGGIKTGTSFDMIIDHQGQAMTSTFTKPKATNLKGEE
jgi:S1-C subfamily serine protease